jgi:hypothetical protein
MRFNRILRCINPVVNPILTNKIACSQCKFYNPNKTCRKFKDINVLGDLVDTPALACREDETKCGEKAVFYREKTEKDYKEEDDKQLVKGIRYPVLFYLFVIFVLQYQ